MRLGDRRQDPDDHQVADALGPLLGVVEARTDVLLERTEHRAAEQLRRDVDLEVELPKLGLEVRVGNQLERLCVGHRRLPIGIGQVQFDLEADRAPLGVEPSFGEHHREHLQAPLDLLAVALALLAAEGRGGELLTHEPLTLGAREPNCKPDGPARVGPGQADSIPGRPVSRKAWSAPSRRAAAVV